MRSDRRPENHVDDPDAGPREARRDALPPLPVPELEPTLERLTSMVAAVGDAADVERVRALAEGADLEARQRALCDRARGEDEAGENWMSAAWREGYLAARGPLTLSGNVVFELALGEAGLADLVHRAATVHLAESRGESDPEVDARGTVMDPVQRRVLDGGLRHPASGVDEVHDAEADAPREVGVLHGGRLFALTVSDEQGRPLSRERIADAVGAVIGRAECGLVAPDGPSFAAMSAIGSGELAEILPGVLADEHNRRVYERLRRMLFTVSVVAEPPASDDPAAAHLLRGLTEPGQAWAYRPVSYLHCLSDGWTAAHVEHSGIDGATLVEVVRRMQAVDEAAATEESSTGDAPSGPVFEELRWSLSEDLADRIDAAVTGFERQAEQLRVDVVRTVRPRTDGLGMKVSLDAVQQAVMALAQQRAYGRVRGVYESVDMRGHRAGRTECLRSVTPELIVFVEAVAGHGAVGERDEGTAETGDPHRVQDLPAADELHSLLAGLFEAHRGWVKACKAGRGVDRHLWGLGLVGGAGAAEGEMHDGGGAQHADGTGADADGQGADAGGTGADAREADALGALLRDPAVLAAREDFLSTTSIGSAEQVVRYAFVPSERDGFGISYTPGEEHLEFCVSHWAASAGAGARGAGDFLDALRWAAERLDAVCARARQGCVMGESEDTPVGARGDAPR